MLGFSRYRISKVLVIHIYILLILLLWRNKIQRDYILEEGRGEERVYIYI